MATITAPNAALQTGPATVTTLTASDTFTFDSTKRSILVLNNVTAGALTVNIDGDGATTVNVSGVGSVDISGGFSTASIPAGATHLVHLNSINKYLSGTIAVTGGTGIEAMLLEL